MSLYAPRIWTIHHPKATAMTPLATLCDKTPFPRKPAFTDTEAAATAAARKKPSRLSLASSAMVMTIITGTQKNRGDPSPPSGDCMGVYQARSKSGAPMKFKNAFLQRLSRTWRRPLLSKSSSQIPEIQNHAGTVRPGKRRCTPHCIPMNPSQTPSAIAAKHAKKVDRRNVPISVLTIMSRRRLMERSDPLAGSGCSYFTPVSSGVRGQSPAQQPRRARESRTRAPTIRWLATGPSTRLRG